MARRAQSAPTSAAAIEDLELLDEAGQSVRVGSLWEDRPVVLVWLRHYG